MTDGAAFLLRRKKITPATSATYIDTAHAVPMPDCAIVYRDVFHMTLSETLLEVAINIAEIELVELSLSIESHISEAPIIPTSCLPCYLLMR